MPLNIEPNFHDPDQVALWPYAAGDEFYESLVESLRGKDPQHALEFLSRIVLVLANHVGDMTVLREAIGVAQRIEGRPPV